jgi:hypothetical protein
MGTDEARWFYVGDGKLRLKNGDDWTDEYQAIESRRDRASQAAVVEPGSGPPLPGARRRGRPLVWLSVCAVLVAAGGTGTAFAKDALRPGGLLSASSAFPATAVVAPANLVAKSRPAWDGRGYTKADYAKLVGGIPAAVADVREDSGHRLATRVDLLGLGLQLEAVGKLPAPPKVDPKWWATSTKTLSRLSTAAADEWAAGNQKAAMAHLATVVKSSNTLVVKVNASFGLKIPLSKTSR